MKPGWKVEMPARTGSCVMQTKLFSLPNVLHNIQRPRRRLSFLSVLGHHFRLLKLSFRISKFCIGGLHLKYRMTRMELPNCGIERDKPRGERIRIKNKESTDTDGLEQHCTDLLAILQKSLDRELFLYIFMQEVRSSGVRASITIAYIRKFYRM